MPNSSHNREKKAIERSTAEIFLGGYNSKQKTSFSINHMAVEGEVPDVICLDAEGNRLNLELRVFGDAPETASFMLGRRTDPLENSKKPNYSLERDTLVQILKAISEKNRKDYGARVALVLRYVGRIWEKEDFERLLPIEQSLMLKANRVFSEGVWVISTENNIVRLEGIEDAAR